MWGLHSASGVCVCECVCVSAFINMHTHISENAVTQTCLLNLNCVHICKINYRFIISLTILYVYVYSSSSVLDSIEISYQLFLLLTCKQHLFNRKLSHLDILYIISFLFCMPRALVFPPLFTLLKSVLSEFWGWAGGVEEITRFCVSVPTLLACVC